MNPCWLRSNRAIPNASWRMIDYHIGHAWREVGKLVREIPA